MDNFHLHERLREDCFVIGELSNCVLLLMRNALYPWFILVPKTQHSEFYQLEQDMQTQLIQHSNMLSRFLKEEFLVDKVNTAIIGNLVQQMHVHVIGRRIGDAAWPGVVWGHEAKQEYNTEQSSLLITRVGEYILATGLPWHPA